MSPRRHLCAIDPTATPEEAAAIVAALERFRLATATVAASAQPAEGWRRAALLEAVERDSAEDVPNPWINT